MIVQHQRNVAGFAGNHIVYWPWTLQQSVSTTTAAATNELIEQARSIARFTQSRIFGRVN